MSILRNKVFAQAEKKRLEAKKMSVQYKKREREEELEKEKEERERYKAEKEWAEGTEHRVGDWREFMGKFIVYICTECLY